MACMAELSSLWFLDPVIFQPLGILIALSVSFLFHAFQFAVWALGIGTLNPFSLVVSEWAWVSEAFWWSRLPVLAQDCCRSTLTAHRMRAIGNTLCINDRSSALRPALHASRWGHPSTCQGRIPNSRSWGGPVILTVPLEPTAGLLRSVLHDKPFCPTLLRECWESQGGYR